MKDMIITVHPEDLKERLELDKVKSIIAAQSMGEPGREKIWNQPIVQDIETIETLLSETEDFVKSIKDSQPLPIRNYRALEENIDHLHIENFVLPVESFGIVKQLLINIRDLNNYFNAERKIKYKNLYLLSYTVEWKEHLLQHIDRVFNEEGEVRSDASVELSSIRKRIQSKSAESDKVFRSLLSKFRQSGWLTESEETMRNGRRVLSVPAEHKRKITGIIHDESATGKTVYLEPDALVQINNEVFSLYIEEKKEIYKIIQVLTGEFRTEGPYLKACEALVAHMDMTQAKAKVAIKMNASKPRVKDFPHFQWIQARHPLLLLKNLQENKPTIPFDLHLIPPNRILLLSGPNAGGKSITMKAVGLIQLMVQSGIPVPVDPASEIGIFKKFFTDIGDRQSIEEDLSTYSSHLQNMKHILDDADSDSLLLIDEFGSGTDPGMGGAIAEALLNQFNKQKSWGVITTHYSNLKIFAFNQKGIVNAAMNFDKEKLQPTYQLHIGKPGSSFAFEIATKSGLPENLLKYARKRAGEKENEVEELLVDLQNERITLQEKLFDLQQKETALNRLTRNYEQAQGDLELRRKRFKMEMKEAALQQTTKENRELEKLIRELKEGKGTEQAKELIRKRKRQNQALQKDVQELKEEVYYKEIKKTDKALLPGVHVKMRTGDTFGIIESIDRKTATVIIGDLRMQMALRDLIPIEAPLEIGRKAGVQFDTIQSNAAFEAKIDIMGFRKDEAIKRVQEFMDQAALSSVTHLEILHGKGDGILKRIVKEKLKEYSFVKQIRHPAPEQGGDGITIVEIGV